MELSLIFIATSAPLSWDMNSLIWWKALMCGDLSHIFTWKMSLSAGGMINNDRLIVTIVIADRADFPFWWMHGLYFATTSQRLYYLARRICSGTRFGEEIVCRILTWIQDYEIPVLPKKTLKFPSINVRSNPVINRNYETPGMILKPSVRRNQWACGDIVSRTKRTVSKTFQDKCYPRHDYICTPQLKHRPLWGL